MAKQVQEHPAAGNPLPPALVILWCQACEARIWHGTINTPELAAELSRLRREHAMAAHDWQPRRRARTSE